MVRDKKKIKLFADGADIDGIKTLHASGQIDGITTNPTLMRKAGVADYEAFAKQVATIVTDIPLSFEVVADDFGQMEKQARKVGGWGKNIYVKIPVSNTKGESSAPLIKRLAYDGVKLNITAILTIRQVKEVLDALCPDTSAFVSVFAGRIADTGFNPCHVMTETAKLCKEKSSEILSLWASTRELINIFQAQECGVDIITVTHDILKKIPMIGQDLDQLSLDTVKMFYNDAVSAGYTL